MQPPVGYRGIWSLMMIYKGCDCLRKLTEIFQSADFDTNNSLTHEDAWDGWLNAMRGLLRNGKTSSSIQRSSSPSENR